MIETGFLRAQAKDLSRVEPTNFTGDQLEVRIKSGEQYLVQVGDNPEVHIAIAGASMVLDDADNGYENALLHLNQALEIMPKNKDALDLKLVCLEYLHLKTGHIQYLVERVDAILCKADLLCAGGISCKFSSTITSSQFKRAFEHSPSSRGVLFFRLGSMVNKPGSLGFDLNEFVLVAKRAASGYQGDRFLGSLIQHIYEELPFDERRFVRRAIKDFAFNDQGNVRPILKYHN